MLGHTHTHMDNSARRKHSSRFPGFSVQCDSFFSCPGFLAYEDVLFVALRVWEMTPTWTLYSTLERGGWLLRRGLQDALNP